MDYYSGIIFQGFAGNVGKPIVMGGRYDKLADQFNSSIPAIGFACDVNALVESTENQQKIYRPAADMIISYEQNSQDAALTAANKLREQGYCVLSYPKECYNSTNAEYTISFTKSENTLQKHDRILPFSSNGELLRLIRDLREVD
jgi:ATP phosphoribosyltransferase regulatory subunit